MIIWLATKKNQKLPDLSLQYRLRKAAESTLYPCLGRGCLYMPSLHGCCGKCSRSVRGAGQTDLESPFLGEQGMVSTVDEFRRDNALDLPMWSKFLSQPNTGVWRISGGVQQLRDFQRRLLA